MSRSTPSPTRISPVVPLPAVDGALRGILQCAIALGAWLALTIALRPLAVPDEGRYVGVAWEMLRSGNWLVPTLNGAPYFHKPPLFYWMTASAIKLFGPGMVAARSASWLAAVALGTGTFAFARRWFGTDIAIRSALVFATLPLLYGGAQFANLDMLVASCIGLCVLAAVHSMLADEQGVPAPSTGVAAFAMAGAGVLAKGLIGVVLPAGVLLVWAAATGRLRPLVRLIASWRGWLVLLAIVAPWFIAMDRQFAGFAHYFFVVQHFERFSASTFNNIRPFWFYVPVLVLGSFPWSIVGVFQYRHIVRAGARTRGSLALLISWIGCIVFFFSLPHSKLIGYVFPVLAPVSILVACLIQQWNMRRMWMASGASAVICVALVAVAAHLAPKSQASLALKLRQEIGSDEDVVFVDNHYFDVAYDARLIKPILVVDRWLPEETAKDSWRRELLDAEAFDVSRKSRLLHPADLAARLCSQGRPAWVLAPKGGGSVPWLLKFTPERRSQDAGLWRVDPRQTWDREAIGCPSP